MHFLWNSSAYAWVLQVVQLNWKSCFIDEVPVDGASRVGGVVFLVASWEVGHLNFC